MNETRRLLLAGGGLSALAALTAPLAATRAEAHDAAATQSTVRFASEFGVVGDGRADDTAALQSAIDETSEAHGTLLLDAGIYAVTGLELRPQARVIGAGAGSTYYPARNGRMGGAVIVPLDRSPSDVALVTIPTGATGVELENLVIDGYNWQWGDPAAPASRVARPGLVVRGGIEVRLRSVRVVRCAHTGIAIERLNNARWVDVSVDRCGTDDTPAMTVRSPADGASNFLVFDELTIERSANTALSVAVGDDPVRDWASNVTFLNLHVESNLDAGAYSFPINSKPLIDVGNVRAVSFIAPQVLGGAAPIIRYRQTISTDRVDQAPGGDARDQQGGLLVLGGQLHVHGGGAKQIAAVEVSGAGRGVVVQAVRFAALPSIPAVAIREDYRFDVSVSQCMPRWIGPPTLAVEDEREASVREYWANTVHGDLVLQGGGLRVGGRQFRVASRSPADATTTTAVDPTSISAGWVDLKSQGPGTDIAGRLYVANWKPVSGGLVTIEFERPSRRNPIVMLTARNGRAAEARLHVELVEGEGGTTGFTICTASELRASTDTMLLDYFVVGRE